VQSGQEGPHASRIGCGFMPDNVTGAPRVAEAIGEAGAVWANRRAASTAVALNPNARPAKQSR
jgi:hypothetical protein